MLLDFNLQAEEIFPHFKGGNGDLHAKMFFDGTNRIMRGRLLPGASIGMHTHENSCEAVFILSGSGTMLCDGAEELLAPGVCTYCPKGHSHSLRNTGSEDLIFFAMVPNQ